MYMSTQQIIFFGDQTVDALACIKYLTRQSEALPSLGRFLRDAADIIQSLLSELEQEGLENFRRFETVLELAEIFSTESGTHDIIACALWTTAQLGDLILRTEMNPCLLIPRPAPNKTYVVGVCGGLIAASASATARDINELLQVCPKIIAVAFRLGIAQWRRALDIETKPGNWAVAIVNIESERVQSILNAFNEDMSLPKHRSLYISSIAKDCVTISGPPSLFPELWAYSSTLSLALKLSLPLGTPAHAAHLPPVNLDDIIGSGEVLNVKVKEGYLLISTSSCIPFTCRTLGELLRDSLTDITGHTLDMAGVNDFVISSLEMPKKVQIEAIGPPSQIGTFKRTLEEAGVLVELRSREPPEPDKEFKVDPNSRNGSNLVAVVGQALRFPGSDDVEAFWENIKSGRKFETEIPASRFDLATHYDATGRRKGSVTTKYGSFIENPGLFDNRLFNVSPREAKQMDPVQRILLMCSYEALQSAGYSPDSSPSTSCMRTATYFGQSGDDWRQSRSSQDVDIYYIPGTIRAFASGKLNYHYKWGGANYSIDSACASSTTCIMLACNALLSRECDMALAGGGQLNAAPETYAALSRAGFLSTTPGCCKTFREDADGYCRGEGVGVVVLKRLEDALAENDNILAVIRGADRNYSWNATSITHPSSAAQIKLVKNVLRKTGVEPDDIGFVEMHGTGTTAGDSVEVETVASVFGARAVDNPLYLGAIKASIGHGEAAAGVASVIKVIEMLRHRIIPQQPGFPGPREPKFSHLDQMNIRIPERTLDFALSTNSNSSNRKRRAMVNNFDASGGNNCLLIEEPPKREPPIAQDPRNTYTVSISARTGCSLKINMERLLSFLEHNSGVTLADIAYTTTARRIHEDIRKAYTVQNKQELVTMLQADIKQNLNILQPQAPPRSVVFLFTGQGAQYSGMGKQLFNDYSPFREAVLSFHEISVWQGFPPFLHIICDGKTELEEFDPIQLQLAVVVLEMALARLWRSWGLTPDLVLGYSLGEYPALYTAGVLSAHDVIFLVGNRAKLMQMRCKLGSYAMLAVQASDHELLALLNKYPSCEVACKSAPRSTVISGPIKDIELLQSEAKGKSLSCTLLNVPYGFHCSQVDPILDDFRDIAETASFCKPLLPVASPLHGTVIEKDGILSSDYLVRQAREPVDFISALTACEKHNYVDKSTLWIEIGPKRVLSSLVKATLYVDQNKLLHTIDDKESNWRTIAKSQTACYLEGLSINWPRFHRHFNSFVRLVDLPTYGFELKDYWIPSARPLQDIKPDSIPTPPLTPLVPGFPTAALQRVRSESIMGDEVVITFESLVSHPTLVEVMRGHKVKGFDLFPASGFMDMAYTAAKYLHFRINMDQPLPAISVHNLSIIHPLIPATVEVQQLLLTTVMKNAGTSMMKVSFKSIEGTNENQHGTCELQFGSEEAWQTEWSHVEHFIEAAKSKVVSDATAVNNSGYRLPRSVAYKLFSGLVTYSDHFCGMQEVFVDHGFDKEAVANIVLSAAPSNFGLNPYWSEALIHVSGFLLNGKPDLTSQVCFFFDHMQQFRILVDELKQGDTYSSYVYINDFEENSKQVGADVYIFKGTKVVGVAKGLSFRRIAKDTLSSVLGKWHPTAQNRQKGDVRSFSNVIGNNMATVKPNPQTPARPKINTETLVEQTESSEYADIIIDIVLAQTNFDRADLHERITWEDMGLDSLCIIEVVQLVRERTNLDLPASFFHQNPTIADARRGLGVLAPRGQQDVQPSTIDTHHLEVTTKNLGGSIDAVLDIVLAQTGFEKTDLQESTRFDSMGLDSLCTIEVIWLVRDQTGIELPASFFNHNPTVADARRALGKGVKSVTTSSATSYGIPEEVTSCTTEVGVQTPHTNGLSPGPIGLPGKEKIDAHHGEFFLMQGKSHSTKVPLFFLPDGTGYPAVLLRLPPVFDGDNPIFTCKSPLLSETEGKEVVCSVEGLAADFAAALRRTRPHGPYLLAGYSLGTIYAFEVAKILADAGETVLGLLLIDFNLVGSISMEARSNRPVPPDLDIDMLSNTGFMNGFMNGIESESKTFRMPAAPPPVRYHAMSAFKSLQRYNPTPMTPDQRPRNTYCIWAGAGMETLMGEMPLHVSYGILDWQMEPRGEKNTPAGWEVYVSGPVWTETVETDHLSIMMTPEWVEKTARIIKRMLKDAMREEI